MISSFLVVSKIKIKYLLNITLYNSKNSLLKKKYKKIDYENVFEISMYAFFNYFSKIILLAIWLILLFGIIPLNYMLNFTEESSLLITIFLSLALGIIRSPLNLYEEDTLYAVEHLKIDYKNYYISNYIIKLILLFSVFFLSVSSIGFLFNYSFVDMSYLLKLSFIYITLRNVGMLYNIKNKKDTPFKYILSMVFMIIGYILVYLNLVLPIDIYDILLITLVFINVLVIIKVCLFKNFKELYEFSYDKYKRKKVVLKSYEKKKYISELSRVEVIKNKNPYKNFINIFDKRYKKVLPKKIGFSSILIFILAILASFYAISSEVAAINLYYNIYLGLPFFVFVLCFMNSAKTYTKNFYIKCDKDMLNHNFYKEKKVLEHMYSARLLYIMKNNLPKTLILSGALALVYYLTGGETLFIEYPIIIISLNLVMIMFSIYHMTSYYLFNPFKKNSDKFSFKSFIILYFPVYISFLISSKFMNIITFGLYTLIAFAVMILLNYLLLKLKINKQ